MPHHPGEVAKVTPEGIERLRGRVELKLAFDFHPEIPDLTLRTSGPIDAEGLIDRAASTDPAIDQRPSRRCESQSRPGAPDQAQADQCRAGEYAGHSLESTDLSRTAAHVLLR